MKRLTRSSWALGLLALIGLEIGLWGLASPRSLYESYPGFGQNWLRDGAFDEHLLRDFAALQLALGALAAVALVLQRRDLRLAAGLAWLLWGLPHAVFHLAHADSGGWLQGMAATTLPVLAAVVLWSSTKEPRGAS